MRETIIPIILHADIDLPYCAHYGEWCDLRAAEDVKMWRGEFKLISLGVSMKLPRGYEAIVAPRSSTMKNFGIFMANGIGVIDSLFCGDNDIWQFPAIALRDTEIHKGDRIAQFRIQQQQGQITFVKTDTLNSEGRGGIGSTGTR